MDDRSVQDFYADQWAHCYGCGRLNEHGLHVQTRWLDERQGASISRFTPHSYHIATPGFVYGGILASLIDCHGIATAALAADRAEQRPFGSEPPVRFVTASLHVDFLRPTPLTTLDLVGHIIAVSERDGRTRKVTTDITVLANQRECVQGKVVGVLAPDDFGAERGA